MRVVILTSSEEVEIYLNQYFNSNDIIYPIGADLFESLILKNVKFINLNNFIDDDIYNINKIESEKIIKETINKLNEYSNQLFEFDDGFKIDIGNYFSFNLHIVLGQLHFINFIIDRLNIKYKPDSWLIFKPTFLIKNRYNGFRPNTLDVFQNIIISKGLEKIHIVKYFKFPTFLDFEIAIKNCLPNIFKNKIYQFKQQKKYQFRKNLNKKNILMIDAVYDWDVLFKSTLFKDKYFVHFLFPYYDSPSFFCKKNEIYNILKEALIYNSTLIFDIYTQSRIISKSLKRFKKIKNKNTIFIKNFHCILNTVFVKPDHNFIAHLANYNKIPVITWQHGEMGSYKDIFQESIETRYTNLYLCYGDGVLPLYQNLINTSAIKEVFPVGNLTKKVNSNKSDYILYATGKWTGVVSPFFENYNTDNTLFHTQKKILNFLDTVSNHKSVFKISNQPNQNSFPFKVDKVLIDSDTPFLKLLEDASVIILDTPSTTLIEAVSTNKPIFLLKGLLPGKWCNNRFLELLQNRALIFDNADDLIKSLDNYLKFNTYNANINDKIFFTEFASKFEDEEIINVITTKIDNI